MAVIFSVLRIFWLKIGFVKNSAHMVGVVSEADVAVLTCNCSDIFLNDVP